MHILTHTNAHIFLEARCDVASQRADKAEAGLRNALLINAHLDKHRHS